METTFLESSQKPKRDFKTCEDVIIKNKIMLNYSAVHS